MKKQTKTNAMRYLESVNVDYTVHTYDHDNNAVEGTVVALSLHEDPACVFKTLITQADTKEFLVFMIPVAHELDLKKAARAAGVKHTAMIPVKEITKVSGYVRGGCSPFAMKKTYRTFIDRSVNDTDTFFCSGGKIGLQVEINTGDLPRFPFIQCADLVRG